MDTIETAAAWLDLGAGEPVRVENGFSFGRSSSSSLALAGNDVSRRHAIIHEQAPNEFYLVDLGSSNGTYVNHRRVAQPVLLRDGDVIQIGSHTCTFRRKKDAEREQTPDTASEMTMPRTQVSSCWLLIADVEGSARLSQTLSSEELAKRIGVWLNDSKRTIEKHGGMINKFLGDGFLAYWSDEKASIQQVAGAIDDLKEVQAAGGIRFRIVAHHGKVAMGGAGALREEGLMGKEVNFAFRMEKLAGSLGASCMVSDAAAKLLAPLKQAKSVGEHELPGFTEKFPFFTI